LLLWDARWLVCSGDDDNPSWIAKRLWMDSAANVNQQIRRFEANVNGDEQYPA
jgi:hypothetical protein